MASIRVSPFWVCKSPDRVVLRRRHAVRMPRARCRFANSGKDRSGRRRPVVPRRLGKEEFAAFGRRGLHPSPAPAIGGRRSTATPFPVSLAVHPDLQCAAPLGRLGLEGRARRAGTCEHFPDARRRWEMERDGRGSSPDSIRVPLARRRNLREGRKSNIDARRSSQFNRAVRLARWRTRKGRVETLASRVPLCFATRSMEEQE
jgi:hypothetical protein